MKFGSVIGLLFAIPAALLGWWSVQSVVFYLRGAHTRGQIVRVECSTRMEPGDTPGSGPPVYRMVYRFKVEEQSYEGIDSYSRGRPMPLGKEVVVVYEPSNPLVNQMWDAGNPLRMLFFMALCAVAVAIAWS